MDFQKSRKSVVLLEGDFLVAVKRITFNFFTFILQQIGKLALNVLNN